MDECGVCEATSIDDDLETCDICGGRFCTSHISEEHHVCFEDDDEDDEDFDSDEEEDFDGDDYYD